MARAQQHSSRPLAAIVLALAFHVGFLQLYEALKPVPLPRLFVHIHGKGAGTVTSSPGDLSCSENCFTAFAPGTRIRLVAVVTEGSTFEGWSEECTPRPDWILECELTIERDTHVQVGFGLVPDEVQVAWVRTEPDEELTITLPDPEIEAELLTEPLAELLAEPEPEALPEIPRVEPPEETPPPPPLATPPPPEIANMRSVEVPDENEVEKAPEDATHLSDKNRDVAEETRAQDTNLEREQAGEVAASAESEVQSEDIGGEEAEIAQLEEEEPPTLEQSMEELAASGQDERALGMVAGEPGERGEDGEEGDDRPTEVPGVLAMRGVAGRGSIVADDKPTGEGGTAGRRGHTDPTGIKTQLDFADYERIVGKEAVEDEMALGRQKTTSMRRGRFERKLGAVKAALENFTPEVRPGNQTALKTRAAPFALFIARMHRRIHELWGFGFLEDLDEKSSSYPLNRWDLFTKLEIVINPDGTVHKVNIVENSGILEFDVAAIDVVLTAAPYTPPPQEIRSPDGRVYIHWGFARDWRQCGTSNAHPFILSEAPAETSSLNDSDLVRSMPRRDRQKDKQDQESDDAAHDAADTPAAGTAGPPSPEDPEAIHTANLWLNGLTHVQPDKMVKVTAVPFAVGGTLVATSAGDIKQMYQYILQEVGPALREWKLMTPAGYRKRFGSLPAGIDDSKPLLLMVVRVAKEQLTLVLTRQESGAYKVTGLHR